MDIPRISCAIPILLLAVVVAGCGQPASPDTNADSGKLNSAAPPSVMKPETSSTQVDPEEPKAGLNTSRPDALKDVSPESR